ncbi:MFS transporter [Marinobacter sp. X15-166B]|uniref:MFS transporter n=1 Tax=Marinobacter sp. X15-166B TaxID=1897620 RepID=UPI00085C5066|nr:MFS transporter [Marinobacter sp. X15-166B]OEY65966.1 MFS transporter permease [Marinobacter sp. X15-166B]
MTQAPTQPHTVTDTCADPARWRILAVVLMAIIMSLISVSVINVALASIQEALDASRSDIQWVLSGYALTFGVVLVSAGRAGDLMGRGGLFIFGVVVFTLASIAAGLAPDADWLNMARFIQGVGAGFLNPQGIGLIQHYFRGAERGRAFGFFGTTVGVSVAIGPVLGGLLIDLGGPEFGWRLTFLINVPVGLLTILLAWLWFPRPLIHKPKLQQGKGLSSLDPVGALLLGSGVLAVLYPFVETHPSGLLWLLFPAGVLLFYLWVRWERWYTRRGFSPMVDLKIFTTSSYRNGSLIMTLYFLGMTSVWVLVPLYVQQNVGFSAFEAGMVGIPSALLSAFSANWAGKRVNHYGRKIVIGGLGCAIFGMLASVAVVLLNEYAGLSIWWLLLSLAFFGLGHGSVVSPNQALTLAEVPVAYAGSSGAIMQTGQRIGTSVGIAVITAIVFAVRPYSSWPVAMSLGLLTIALVILLALGMAVKDLRDRSVAETPAGSPVTG